MATDSVNSKEHLGDALSGYIDGELTQQQRQRVELHCEGCDECASQLDALAQLRARVRSAPLTPYGEDTWREMLDDTAVQFSRGLGWLLLIGGALALGAILLLTIIKDPTVSMQAKVVLGAFYAGGAALFISVLRQRLLERKTDKYKDVEI